MSALERQVPADAFSFNLKSSGAKFKLIQFCLAAVKHAKCKHWWRILSAKYHSAMDRKSIIALL